MPGHHHSPCDDGVIQAQRIGAIPALSKPFPTKQARLALAATVLGSSMAFIDGPVVNIALPAIQSDFSGGVSTGASLADMQWVINAYWLALGSLVLVGGSLGDRFGRRTIFIMGIAIFAGASSCAPWRAARSH